MVKIEEVIIIGGGPAGLAAAIYNARAGLSPLMFAGAPYGGQLMLTSEVENYPGFESILGPDLIEKMRLQAKKFGTKVLDKNIIKVDFTKSPFELYTSEEKYLAKSVNITTGAKAIWLGLESETRLRGKGVSACATCDGFFFKDKVVAVVGGGDSAMEESLTLTKFASKVYLIHRKAEFRASQIMQDRVKKHPKIEILWNTEVEEVLGKTKVEGIKIKSTKQKKNVIPSTTTVIPSLTGNLHSPDPRIREDDDESSNFARLAKREFRVLSVDGLFVAIGHKPDTDIFKGQIELDEKGYILTSAVNAVRINKFLINLISNQTPNPKNQKIGKLDIGNYLGQLDQLGISNFDYGYQYMTSVNGIFASGDCVDHSYRQAGTAVGMGIAAALEVERWLEANSKL